MIKNSDATATNAPPQQENAAHTCSLCSDEGLPARVLRLDESLNLATVQIEGGEREVALDLLDGVGVGDFVLVHLDTAIARLDPQDVIQL